MSAGDRPETTCTENTTQELTMEQTGISSIRILDFSIHGAASLDESTFPTDRIVPVLPSETALETNTISSAVVTASCGADAVTAIRSWASCRENPLFCTLRWRFSDAASPIFATRHLITTTDKTDGVVFTEGLDWTRRWVERVARNEERLRSTPYGTKPSQQRAPEDTRPPRRRIWSWSPSRDFPIPPRLRKALSTTANTAAIVSAAVIAPCWTMRDTNSIYRTASYVGYALWTLAFPAVFAMQLGRQGAILRKQLYVCMTVILALHLLAIG